MPTDWRGWAAKAADDAIERAAAGAPAGKPVVCASGISPSGPVHLGNLREIIVPHLVAEEIKSRGVPCEHILSWDDYDRLRKVPAGVPADFAEHIGQPLTAVPDPWGEYPNWAERFKTPFRAALRQLGIEIREISQTEMYTSGAYTAGITKAINEAARIDAILDRYRTLRPAGDTTAGAGGAGAGAATAPDETDASEASGAAEENEDAGGAAGIGYFPFRPYCGDCGRDTTAVTAYDAPLGAGQYACHACGNKGAFSVTGPTTGKLVWKIDWPMRWAYENVAFEAGGVDHSSPGSSFTVGSQIVREIFGGQPPVYLPYSFVGARGAAKLSGSRGGAPTPADALRVLEPGILRWIYARRRPNQAITVDFGPDVLRIYDEWDALNRRVDEGTAEPADVHVVERSRRTVDHGEVARPAKTFPFRLLSSICDITADDESQMLRIVRQVRGGQDEITLDDLQPRADCARGWTREHVPAEQRTIVRDTPDRDLLASLSADEAKAVAILVDGLAAHWSLEGLTTLVYAVPKLLRGLPADAPANAELKQAQRAFFVLVYRLLIGKDTGPRLPTLLLAVGEPRIRTLLTDA
ncbi:lysyl-tRNA synthetase, class I [Frankia sp. EI5c]|uniref:lysine--tRNA ligase n=1 Tax=Frankia sp. EI5c TaxID=683316 RepID=UPI0007C2E3FA|nr:lysine--tRNA ligase [Frankia sp. EI5c]OAA23369.1 lysyl-tRNA synthetase, class I [Frankia sp. EI5c]